MWAALEELCMREGITLHEFCTEVERRRGEATLTAAIRAEIVTYYRRALARATRAF